MEQGNRIPAGTLQQSTDSEDAPDEVDNDLLPRIATAATQVATN